MPTVEVPIVTPTNPMPVQTTASWKDIFDSTMRTATPVLIAALMAQIGLKSDGTPAPPAAPPPAVTTADDVKAILLRMEASDGDALKMWQLAEKRFDAIDKAVSELKPAPKK